MPPRSHCCFSESFPLTYTCSFAALCRFAEPIALTSIFPYLVCPACPPHCFPAAYGLDTVLHGQVVRRPPRRRRLLCRHYSRELLALPVLHGRHVGPAFRSDRAETGDPHRLEWNSRFAATIRTGEPCRLHCPCYSRGAEGGEAVDADGNARGFRRVSQPRYSPGLWPAWSMGTLGSCGQWLPRWCPKKRQGKPMSRFFSDDVLTGLAVQLQPRAFSIMPLVVSSR